jgi:hypothetical protein
VQLDLTLDDHHTIPLHDQQPSAHDLQQTGTL